MIRQSVGGLATRSCALFERPALAAGGFRGYSL